MSNVIDFKSKKMQSDEILCNNIIELSMSNERILIKWLAGVLADCKKEGNEDRANLLIEKALEEKCNRLRASIQFLAMKENL